MKKTNLVLLIATLGVVGTANTAFATDGVITVNGKVITSTCALTGSAGATGTASSVTVQLDTVPNSAFTAANSTTGTKDFTVSLTNSAGTAACDAVTIAGLKAITLSGTSGTNYDATSKSYLINTDTTAPATKDVYVQILNLDGVAPVDFSLTKQITATATGVFPLKARYISKIATPVAQTVKTSINYVLEYN